MKTWARRVVRSSDREAVSSALCSTPRSHDPTNNGFTLLEVVVAIALSLIILAALHFSLVAALESWHYSQSELSLQKTLADTLESVMEGTPSRPGLRSSLEIIMANEHRLEMIEAVVEEHRIFNPRAAIYLRGYLKRGTGLPSAEYQPQPGLPFLPVDLEWDNIHAATDRASFRIARSIPAGSRLRLGYHPDPERSPDALIGLEWNPETKVLQHHYRAETTDLSKNMFGVELTQCLFRYYNRNNQPLAGEHRESVAEDLIPLITAVEVQVTGEVQGHKLNLKGMAMLRNSPRQRGLIPLKKDLQIPIADSQDIKTFALGNFSGVTDSDRIVIEIVPKQGSPYRITLEFEDIAKSDPLIGLVQIEYPPGTIIYSDTLRTPAKQGIDFLTLGPNGLFDYDDDADVDDPIYIQGPAVMIVSRMDIRGAGCFLRP